MIMASQRPSRLVLATALRLWGSLGRASSESPRRVPSPCRRSRGWGLWEALSRPMANSIGGPHTHTVFLFVQFHTFGLRQVLWLPPSKHFVWSLRQAMLPGLSCAPLLGAAIAGCTQQWARVDDPTRGSDIPSCQWGFRPVQLRVGLEPGVVLFESACHLSCFHVPRCVIFLPHSFALKLCGVSGHPFRVSSLKPFGSCFLVCPRPMVQECSPPRPDNCGLELTPRSAECRSEFLPALSAQFILWVTGYKSLAPCKIQGLGIQCSCSQRRSRLMTALGFEVCTPQS